MMIEVKKKNKKNIKLSFIRSPIPMTLKAFILESINIALNLFNPFSTSISYSH